MSKRPAFQFYPADWRNDQGLRLCSAGARSLWIDMLCLMHEGDPYGHLTVLNRPMSPEALAKLVGEGAAPVRRWLAELRENDVYSVTAEGLVFSRRMVRDEEIRDARARGGPAGAEHGSKGAEHGRKGGRPRKEEGGSGAEQRGDNKPPLKPPPSSSSSSSTPEEGSEDKSSGAEVAEIDLDKVAWSSAVEVLTTQGGLTAKDARAFFGKLLSRHQLRAKELLAATADCRVTATQDPKSYLTRWAQSIARRTQGQQPAKRVGFV